MTVDKMELLKRYKELKAQGVNITLMELKKQLEAENDNNNIQIPDSSTLEATNTTSEPQQIGFNSINQSEQTQASWTTSYYCAEPQTITPETYSGNIPSETIQNSTYSDNFNANYTWGASTQPEVKSQIIDPQPAATEQPKETYNGPAKYCLIGYPLGHSLSTFIHKAGFKSLNLDSSYDILETPPDSLVDRIKFLKTNNFAGFNVTIPLKLPVTLFLDEVDSSADIVGAVNTVIINPDKTMKGYNTDVIGFKNAIPDDIILAGKVAGVLGTGGAARAAITALAQSQVRKIKVFTRNIPNCAELMTFLRSKFPLIEFEVYQIERIRDLSDIDILVNTTPIGMQGRAADLTPVEENEL
ncbi:MAG: hypothetical protein K2F57_04085, partial [Candidatus Gastranaerophilales bacterium]|nr:hypothetical protein [Candidatus Gastranaerophilales bacterium]